MFDGQGYNISDMRRLSNFLLCFVILMLMWPLVAITAEFNFGLGMVGLNLHHYRGADQSSDYYLPIPYFEYYGKSLEVEPSFFRVIFYRKSFFKIQLSVNGGLKVESGKNNARQGMPQLDYTYELGAVFQFEMANFGRSQLQFEFPVRRAFKTDFKDSKAIGTVYATYLNYRLSPVNWDSFSLEICAGALFADQNYHDYYYTVSSEYATQLRPAYKAKGGYAGKTVLVMTRLALGHFVLFPFIRYDDLQNAAFEDGPLVKRNNYLIFGSGLYYIF